MFCCVLQGCNLCEAAKFIVIGLAHRDSWLSPIFEHFRLLGQP